MWFRFPWELWLSLLLLSASVLLLTFINRSIKIDIIFCFSFCKDSDIAVILYWLWTFVGIYCSWRSFHWFDFDFVGFKLLIRSDYLPWQLALWKNRLLVMPLHGIPDSNILSSKSIANWPDSLLDLSLLNVHHFINNHAIASAQILKWFHFSF